MRIKVCGMRDAENLSQVLALQPDYVGFIFYERSPRFVGEDLDAEWVRQLPRPAKKVGVFVNASIDHILRTVRKYGLDFVQLHGEELPDFCRNLKLKGVSVIKAFRLDETFSFSQLNNYKPHCDFFLFDTKGPSYGGNGTVFDWNLLKRYDNDKPFFISGGIGLDNVSQLSELAGLKIHAIDVNSRFETAPGVKNIEALRELVQQLRPVETEVEAG
jgi:phosphoribosylanthranilate isomerase